MRLKENYITNHFKHIKIDKDMVNQRRIYQQIKSMIMKIEMEPLRKFHFLTLDLAICDLLVIVIRD